MYRHRKYKVHVPCEKQQCTNNFCNKLFDVETDHEGAKDHEGDVVSRTKRTGNINNGDNHDDVATENFLR